MPAKSTQLPSKRAQVRQHVIEQIAGGLTAHSQLPTEQAMAEALGVSKSTIRKAFEDLVAEGLIYQEQGRGTFVRDDRHPLVREHWQQQVHMVGYVAPFEFDDRFMTEISMGVEEGLDHDHFLLMSKHIHVPNFAEEAVLPRLVDRLQGLILMSTMTPGATKLIRQLHESRYPLVLIDRYLPDSPISYVVTDNHEAGVMATEHLIELGHREIVHVWAEPMLTSVDDRIKGYRTAMKRHGLKAVEQCVPHDEHTIHLDGWIDSLLADELPTAIFAMCDSLAISICQALEARQVRVPEEVSVIGIDGNRESARVRVPLTTVSQPKFQMGYKAACLLQDLVLDRTRPGTGIQLQPKLEIRNSTAPARTGGRS